MKAITLTLGFLLAFAVFGDQVTDLDNRMTAPQKDRAINMEKQIMAACCFGGPVHSHGQNDYTEEERVEIRQLILDGKSDDQILDYFRNKIDPRTGKPYGNRILAAPKSNELLGQISYWMVAVFTLLGAAVLWIALRRLLSGRKNSLDSFASSATPDKVNDKILEKVESELKNMDKD